MSTPNVPGNAPAPGSASAPQPHKRLPVKPSEENLKKQAKRRAKQDSIPLVDAQHHLATEYGSHNWAELMHVVETMNRGADQLVSVKRTVEPLPAAVRAQDVALVRTILASGQFTQHDLDAGLAHAGWYGGEAAEVLQTRKMLFDLLLDQGADPDGQYGSAYGPIVFGTGECLDTHGLQWLIDAGADVTFPPVETKYGKQCPLGSWLGGYTRGLNERKYRGIDILLKHNTFIPPEVTPPILAIHRGDVKALGELLEKDPSLIRKTFADMPYGNMLLRGASLLHCAVEFGEIECVDLLLSRGADINLPADVIDGLGGQTPIFHAIAQNQGYGLKTLEHLVQRASKSIDMTVRTTFRLYANVGGEPQTTPVTPMEYAQQASGHQIPKWRRASEQEIALLKSI